MKRAFIFLFIFYYGNFLFAQSIKVTINGIRNSKGTIRLAFYTNSKDFDDEKAYLVKTIQKSTMVNGSVNVSYSGLKPGTYGIAILDDENSNDKMDYGLVLPKEGFGFSNYYHTAMSRPKFESFDFVLGKENIAVEIKVRYL